MLKVTENCHDRTSLFWGSCVFKENGTCKLLYNINEKKKSEVFIKSDMILFRAENENANQEIA